MSHQEFSNSRKVLMVAYVFPPIAYAGSYRTLRFCRYLPPNGWIPHVLTIKESDDLDNDYGLLDRIPKEVKVHRTRTIDFWRLWNSRKKNIQFPGNPKGKENINKNIEGKRKSKWLSSIKTFLWELVTIPDHMVFWIPFAVLKGIQILRKEKCNLIYTSSPPHSEQIIGLILSKIFKKPWVADFRDPMLDSSGYLPASRLRLKIDRMLEKLVVKNTDQVIIISDHYKKIICGRYPDMAHKFVTLPNGFDSEIFQNLPSEHFDKFTIIYSGSFYSNRKPDFFIKAFKKWLSTQPSDISATVQVIFYGLNHNDIEKIVFEEELTSVVRLEGLIPQNALIPKLKGANLLLLIIGFDEESRGTVTSKVFEYMACNRPILAIIPEGDASRILQSYSKVYWVNREDENLLMKCLDQALGGYLKNESYSNSSIENRFVQETNAYDAKTQTKVLANIFLEPLSK